MSAALPRLEFRLAISPTRSFYDRVHFFCAALRRLGGQYADALVRTFKVRDRLNAILTSEMRCQIACTLISYQFAVRQQNLSAAFNAANDGQRYSRSRDEGKIINV